jgi:hypothetical protein
MRENFCEPCSKTMAQPQFVLYYKSDPSDPSYDLCRAAYLQWHQHRATAKNSLVWVQDLADNSEYAQKYRTANLPVLRQTMTPFTEYSGQEALTQLSLVYGDAAPAVNNASPPLPSPPHAPSAPVLPPSFTEIVQAVKPRYALYTNDAPHEIKVPRNGVINVQSYDLVATTLGDKLPTWLKKASRLPILASLEKTPTVWYGLVARDQCSILCLLNGGTMI